MAWFISFEFNAMRSFSWWLLFDLINMCYSTNFLLLEKFRNKKILMFIVNTNSNNQENSLLSSLFILQSLLVFFFHSIKANAFTLLPLSLLSSMTTMKNIYSRTNTIRRERKNPLELSEITEIATNNFIFLLIFFCASEIWFSWFGFFLLFLLSFLAFNLAVLSSISWWSSYIIFLFVITSKKRTFITFNDVIIKPWNSFPSSN